MKIAMTIWNGRISPVFDVSQRILILDIQENEIVSRREEKFVHDEPLQKVSQINSLSIQTLICGAISNHCLDLLFSLNIWVIPFITGEIETIMSSFLAHELLHQSFLMPGCRKKCQRRRRGCCRE